VEIRAIFGFAIVLEPLMRMRRLLALSLLLMMAVLSPALADPPIPALTGRVVDDADVLSTATVDAISAKLQGYEAATTNQVVVVTLPDLKGYPIEDWGLALGRGWGLGQKGKDNGVILIVAPKDRQLRIEVGYGLEGVLPDATADQIIRTVIIPRFKSGDLEGGISSGVDAILSVLGGNSAAAFAAPAPKIAPAERFGEAIGPFIPVVFFLIFIGTIVLTQLRHGTNPRTGRYGWYFILDSGPTSSHGGLSSGRGFGGFSGGGGFGGGFHGGGGSFGGGGASGRW
jgi:uncharacterized protein